LQFIKLKKEIGLQACFFSERQENFLAMSNGYSLLFISDVSSRDP